MARSGGGGRHANELFLYVLIKGWLNLQAGCCRTPARIKRGVLFASTRAARQGFWLRRAELERADGSRARSGRPFADALGQLLRDKELRQMTGKAGRDPALREAAIGKVVAACMDVGSELLPQGRR